jgi:hypothetical protein
MHAGRLSNVYVLMHSASGPTFLAAAQDAAAGTGKKSPQIAAL